MKRILILIVLCVFFTGCFNNSCGDGVCAFGEPEICPPDCPPPTVECHVASDCDGMSHPPCDGEWDCVATMCRWMCDDVPVCGDGVCEDDETPSNCPEDCETPVVCGDGICEGDENPVNCPEDCEQSSGDIVWESLGGPEHSGNPWGLLQNPANHDELFLIITQDGPGNVFKSSNRGEDWTKLIEFKDIKVNDMVAHQDEIYFVGDGIHRYKDGILELISPPGYWAADALLHEDKLFALSPRGAIGDPMMISYADISEDQPEWYDISPTASELSDLIMPTNQFWKSVQVSGFEVADNRLIASIGVGTESEDINAQVYYSDDQGETWDKSTNTFPQGKFISSFEQDPADVQHLVLGLRTFEQEDLHPITEMVYESFDAGTTWSSLIQNDYPIHHVSDIVFQGNYLYIIPDFWHEFLKIRNSVLEVIPGPDMPGTMGSSLFKLFFDMDDPSTSYGFLSWGYGLVKSVDNMNSWRKIEHGIVASSPTIVLPHTTDKNTIYTSGNFIQDKYYTRDFGETWQIFMPDDIRGDEARIDPLDTDNIIYMSEGTDMYRSEDGGDSFERIAEGFRGTKIPDIQVAVDGAVYTSNLGFGITINPSDIWDPRWEYLRKSPDYAYTFRTHPVDSDIIYVGQSPKIFEDYSTVLKYDRSDTDNYGWTELVQFPDTAGITSLDINPHDSDEVIVGVTGERGSLHRSVDEGDTWDALAPAFTFTTIHAMTANAQGGVYAAPWGDGIHLSQNGDGWTKLLNAPFSVANVRVNPDNPTELLAADRTAPIVWKSNDKGDTWTRVFDAGSAHYRLLALEYDPENTRYAYTSTFSQGDPMAGSVFKVDLQTGKGTDITNELPQTVLDVAVNPAITYELYASTHTPGVWKSIDGGASWTDTNYPGGGGNDVFIDPLAPGRVFVASGCDETTSCGVYLYDGGWSQPLMTNGQVKAIASSGSTYVAVGADGAYISRNGGASWNLENDGLDFLNGAQVAITTGSVYVGTLGGGVYKARVSENPLSWEYAGLEAEIKNIRIHYDPVDAGTIYTSAYPGGVFKSVDNGETWSEANFALPTFTVLDPLTQGYYSLAIDPNDNQVLYLGLFGRGVYKSEDGAATWTPLYGAQGQNAVFMRKRITSVQVNPADSRQVYASSLDGIYHTRDGGATWKSLNAGLPTLEIKTLAIIDPSLHTLYLDGIFHGSQPRIIAGTNGYGAFALVDGSWESLGQTMGFGWWDAWDRRIYQFGSFRFDPDVEDRVYLGHFPGGFFISEDGGRSWHDSSAGIGNDGLFSLHLNPHDHDELWAGSYNGVVKSADRGVTWTLKSEGMPSEQWVYTVAFHPTDANIMYATSKNGQNKGFCERNTFCGVVMKSTDGGETWFEIMDGLPERSEYYTLLFHPDDAETLFLSTNKGVYMTTNAGENWFAINEGLPTIFNQVRDNVAENLAVTADNSHLLLTLVNHGVWKADISALS